MRVNRCYVTITRHVKQAMLLASNIELPGVADASAPVRITGFFHRQIGIRAE